MSTNYERLTHSSKSRKDSGTASGLFSEIDTDGDGVIDQKELANYVAGSGSGYNSRYESSSYRSKHDYDVSDISTINKAASYTAETNSLWSKYGAEVRGEGLYVDPHPQIIRRDMPVDVRTYEQRIQIRFFQPPPAPPAGPLIIKEVRPPQQAPLPPLRIRQEEPPAPRLPPIILRERPPVQPDSLPSETIIKKLPALPPPPRSVIIERIPAPPAPPRDIIIERWLPYTTAGERKTIVERSEETREYEQPHNVIIQYEPTSAQVVRKFQQLGVTQENPRTYISRYGNELLDTDTLIRQVRAAGVVEDISIPVGITSGSSSRYLSSDISYGADAETTLGSTVSTGYRGGYSDDENSGFRSVSYKSSSYSYGTGNGSNVGSTGFSSTEAKL
ncbi:unnamed protein product [Adineta ricciae]|uniref:EF-hand domain-containing protein n=1 Tax=Adineta ricciae TaxID=249248 RepID=A0A814K008_ADIRI|nr:unnamed protein product [Adineta ricciae]